MLLTYFFFMQAQPPQKVSWLLWTVGAFFFLAGLALLIFLIKKRRQLGVEDEPEFKKLFTDDSASVETPAFEASPLSDEAVEIPEPEAEPDVLSSLSKNFPDREAENEETGEQVETADPEVVAPVEVAQKSVEPLAHVSSAQPVEEKVAEQIYRPPASEERIFRPASEPLETSEEATFTLSSAQGNEATSRPLVAEDKPAPVPEEASSVDEETSDERQGFEHSTSTLVSAPQVISAVPDIAAEDSAPKPLVSQVDEVRSARIEPPNTQQNFAPQISNPSRESFEPPRIEPLVPQSQQSATTPPSTSRPTKISTALPAPETRLDREPLMPFANDLPQTNPASLAPAQPELVTTRTAEPAWHAPQAGRKVAGAVLGLPVETTDAPLVLGKPVIAEDEIGVTGFRNYGKAPDASDTGRGGLITLLIVLLLIGGGVAAYFKIPSFHSRVDSLLLRLRTGSAAPETVVEKPKAQVIPSRNPEVNKNIVKAKGAVLNISEDTLEELAVEVSFYRAEKVIETRTVAVTPSTLAPGTQGAYEFEYDGSKSNGFALYSVTKLTSKNGEIKFTSAKQQ